MIVSTSTVDIHGMELARSSDGKFEPKGEELRVLRSIRLTDTCWERLGEVAQVRQVSRADLIERATAEGMWSEDYQQDLSDLREDFLGEIESLIDEILDDDLITRQRKDRTACKRALSALLEMLK
jgi:hypothetical protein